MTAASLDLSIAEARERIVAGELSPVALTEAYLERIERADGELNVFRTVAADGRSSRRRGSRTRPGGATRWARWPASRSR